MGCFRVSLNGVMVYPFSSTTDLITFVSNRNGILVAINAEKILHATEKMRSIINRNIGYCDGFGAVMALKNKGYKDVVKIPGCELWLKIIEATFKSGKTYYLVGSKQNVIEQVVFKLRLQFPGIKIVNFRNGFIKTPEEKEKLLNDIKSKKPDMIFVAMGSPKQEFLMEEMYSVHPALYQGLGGSFDVYVGSVKRAPSWWITHNLEWAYRLIKEPVRIKRQIKLVKFWLLVILKKI